MERLDIAVLLLVLLSHLEHFAEILLVLVMLLNSVLDLLQHVLLIQRFLLELFVKRPPQFVNSIPLVMDLLHSVLPIK